MRNWIVIGVFFAILCSGFSATANPCPLVMIVLDRSGSMAEDPSGGSTAPSKLDIAKAAINTLMQKYGDRIPFGYTTFQQGTCSQSPGDGVDILDEPMPGNKTSLLGHVNATVIGGGTNTALAVRKVAADPAMKDATRPGSYMMLITDGDPTCSGDPNTTQTELAKASKNGIKTYLIGFGALSATEKTNMDNFADAGGVPCDPAKCMGHKFYSADSAMALDAAIDAISQQIEGEFSGQCDDSCYSNGCPNAGEICVQGKCKADPCATVKNTCAPADYCYTDGNSAGTCVRACTTGCAQGQICTPQGMCASDPCATVTCDTGTVCKNGNCVTDACSAKPCGPGLLCFQGSCIDNPCSYITCPTGTQCTTGTGACLGTLSSMPGMNMGTNHTRNDSGCDVGSGASSESMLAALALLTVALVLRLRRRAE